MPAPDRTGLAEELAQVVSLLNRRMRAASPQGSLTPSQRIALGRLSEGPATTAALARVEHVRPQSMRATLAVLEEQHLVARRAHPTDGRQVVFSLTEAGRQRVGAVRAAKQSWLAEAVEAQLDPAERQRLAAAVQLLRKVARS